MDGKTTDGSLGNISSDHRTLLTALTISLAMFGFGWLYGLIGPSLPDLQLLTGTNLQEVSLLLTMNGVGRLIGTIVLGFLYDRTEQKLVLFVFLTLCAALATAALPWSNIFPIFLVIMMVIGFALGGITCGSTTILGSLYGKHGRRFLQMGYFAVTFGGTLAPLAATPFFAKRVHKGMDSSSYNQTDFIETVNNTHITDLSLPKVFGKSYVYVPFAMNGGLFLITGILFLYLITSKTDEVAIDQPCDSVTEHNAENICKPSNMPRCKKYFFLVCLGLFRLVYYSIEVNQQGYLTTFVSMQLEWHSSRGAVLTSALWGCMAFGRFIGIFIVRHLNPAVLIYSSLFGILGSAVGQFAGGYFKINYLIYIFVPLSGLSMSVVAPSLVAWVNENVTRVSGKVSAILTSSSSFAILVSPLYISFLIEECSTMWYIYIQFIQCAVSMLLFTVMFVGVRLTRKAHEENEELHRIIN